MYRHTGFIKYIHPTEGWGKIQDRDIVFRFHRHCFYYNDYKPAIGDRVAFRLRPDSLFQGDTEKRGVQAADVRLESDDHKIKK